MKSAYPLVEIWAQRSSLPLNDWVRGVSDCYTVSQVSITTAARILHTRPAEIFACLTLAALDDEPLSEIAKVNPPSTTWLSLAYASEVGRKAALNALKSMSGESSPCLLVDTAIEDVGGGSAASRVARLDGDTLSVIVKKAENYGALTPKTMKALKNFARNQKMGKLLTPAQIGYLEGILRDLVARGVIKRDSLDGDQDICNLVMDALGL